MESATPQPSLHRPTLIVVLGMHRSGTSVATRALETLGASFGGNLITPVVGVNPKGFFEDLDVHSLDIELMNALGVDWFALPAPDFDRLESVQLDEFKSRAVALLRAKCSSGIFALKDPRLCRLLPFWQTVFDQLDARVLYVVAFRNPISVARSLEARDSLPAEHSYLLWLAHVAPALRYTMGRPRALVNYDSMMEAPRDALKRLAAVFGLPLDPHKCEAFERDFLEDGLRHTQFKGEDLDRVENAPAVMKELYSALEAYADVASPTNARSLDERLAGTEAFLAGTAPALARSWQLEQQLRKAHLRNSELEQTVEAQETRLANLERALEEANTRIGELEQCARESDDVRIAMDATIQSLKQSRLDMESVAIVRQKELVRTMSTLNEVLDSTSWRITAPLRAVRKRLHTLG